MNYPRRKYAMTQADYDKIIEACRPIPMIMLNISTPRSQQERANDAWGELGSRMGFDAMTVEPGDDGILSFTAVPTETPEQREEREHQERMTAHRARIDALDSQIAAAQKELAELNATKP